MITLDISSKSSAPGGFSEASILALALASYRSELYKEWKKDQVYDDLKFHHQAVEDMATIARISAELAIQLGCELSNSKK